MPDRCRKTYRTLSVLGFGPCRRPAWLITAVVVESRNMREVSAAYGVARSWIYELLGRYRTQVRQRSSRGPADRTATRLRSLPRLHTCVQALLTIKLPEQPKAFDQQAA